MLLICIDFQAIFYISEVCIWVQGVGCQGICKRTSPTSVCIDLDSKTLYFAIAIGKARNVLLYKVSSKSLAWKPRLLWRAGNAVLSFFLDK